MIPRVKVCGITRPDDLWSAVAAGADAVGLVHHPPSSRHLEVAAAAALVAGRPAGARAVLVVVDAGPHGALALLRATGVDLLQLCGDQRPEDWRGFPVPLLRRVAVDERARGELDAWRDVAAGFVLDHPSGPGGTGQPVDALAARELCDLAPCLLAGGLGPEDVADAVVATGCAGVDASSRLEASPGVKDLVRLASFVRTARRALAHDPR